MRRWLTILGVPTVVVLAAILLAIHQDTVRQEPRRPKQESGTAGRGFSVAKFDSLLRAELWPILSAVSAEGVFTRYEMAPTGRSVTLIVENDWYSLPYGRKKDLTGMLWNVVGQLHTRAGASRDAPCHLYIEDRWGETLAEGSSFSGVKVNK